MFVSTTTPSFFVFFFLLFVGSFTGVSTRSEASLLVRERVLREGVSSSLEPSLLVIVTSLLFSVDTSLTLSRDVLLFFTLDFFPGVISVTLDFLTGVVISVSSSTAAKATVLRPLVRVVVVRLREMEEAVEDAMEDSSSSSD